MGTSRGIAIGLVAVLLLSAATAAAAYWPQRTYVPADAWESSYPLIAPSGARIVPAFPCFDTYNLGTVSTPANYFSVYWARCWGDADYHYINMLKINDTEWWPACYDAYGRVCPKVSNNNDRCCDILPPGGLGTSNARFLPQTASNQYYKGGFLLCPGPAPSPPPPPPSPPPRPPPPFPPAPKTPTAMYDVPPPPPTAPTAPPTPPTPAANATTAFAGVLYGECAAALGAAAAVPLMLRPDQMRTAWLYCVGEPGRGVPFAVGSNNGQPNCFRSNGTACVAGSTGCPCGVVSAINASDLSGAGKCLVCPTPAPITAPTYGACTTIFQNWDPFYGAMNGTRTKAGVFLASGTLPAQVSCAGYPATYNVGNWTVGGYNTTVACFNALGGACGPGSTGCPCNLLIKPALSNGLSSGGGQCLICPPLPAASPPRSAAPPPSPPPRPPPPPSPFFLSAAGLDGTCLSSPGNLTGFLPYTSLSYSFCYDTGSAVQTAFTQVTNNLECNGNDLAQTVTYEATSAANCANYCTSTFPMSKAMAYIPKSGPNCRCKSSLPPPVGPMWSNSYGSSCYLLGAMLPGNYIMSAQNFVCTGNDVGTTQQAASVDSCANVCVAVKGAIGFMFRDSGACTCKKTNVVLTSVAADSDCYIFNTPANATGMKFTAFNDVNMLPYTLSLGSLAWNGVTRTFRLQGQTVPKAIGGDGITAMVGTLNVTCAPSWPSLSVSQSTLLTTNFGLVACKGCGNFTFAYAGPKGKRVSRRPCMLTYASVSLGGLSADLCATPRHRRRCAVAQLAWRRHPHHWHQLSAMVRWLYLPTPRGLHRSCG
jgi:hypothetical protein